MAVNRARFDPIHEIMKPYDIELINDPIQLIATIHDICSLSNGRSNGVSGDSSLGSACVGLDKKNEANQNLIANIGEAIENLPSEGNTISAHQQIRYRNN